MQAIAYRRAALACTAIAIAASLIAGGWMINGIAATEADTPARLTRIIAGAFLIGVELAALWIAAWLPAAQRKTRAVLITIAALIALIDIGQIAIAQIALHHNTQQAATANDQAVQQLRASIDRNAATVTRLHASAAVQAESKFPQSRADGATSLRLAAEIETRIANDRAQLEQLSQQHSNTTPISDIIGQGGIIALSIALSTLVTLAAAGATHLSGYLTRQARETRRPAKKRPAARSTAKATASNNYPPGVIAIGKKNKKPQGNSQFELFREAS